MLCAGIVHGDLSEFNILVGAEGPGLEPKSVEACTSAVRIPMRSGVDSLNVATSLGVVAAFAAAQRGWR